MIQKKGGYMLDSGTHSFYRMAPMSSQIKWMTGLTLLIPIVFLAVAQWSQEPLSSLFDACAMGMLVLYGLVWLLMRPTGFRLEADGLVITWPLRQRKIFRREILQVDLLDRDDLRARTGHAMRVGVAGLWGVFGWLSTSERGRVDLYVSGFDDLVWIDCKSGRPLVITPQRAGTFVARIGPAVR